MVYHKNAVYTSELRFQNKYRKSITPTLLPPTPFVVKWSCTEYYMIQLLGTQTV